MPKKHPVTVFLFLWICSALLASCDSPQLPTPVPTAVLPTLPPPTNTPLPPTLDLSVFTVTPEPTATLPPPPSATPTPVNEAVLITVPDEGANIVLGSDILVRGLAERAPTDTVWLTLEAANGRLLVETQAVTGDTSWEAGFTVPPFVSGTGFLHAIVRDEAGNPVAESKLRVNLVLDTETAGDRWLALSHPLREETAVAGFNLFFDGMVRNPTDNLITISVWTDNCQTRVARQSFVLGTSTRGFYWQGFVVIPHTVSGPACAIAHFGEPGTENWREAQQPIVILPPDDEAAKGVRIGNPPAGSTVTAGQELLLYGTALNVSEGPVNVLVLLENGRIIGQATTVSDFWGYWETPILLPFDVEGSAEIIVSTGEPDSEEYAEARTSITINPAPTPTPAP
ncbi:MAG: hypothetical protein D6706_17650 [Chloroflexi bacterium]|nr:MAG: hypothetical protein D6706_17650 [Chloroflexota bacterium]